MDSELSKMDSTMVRLQKYINFFARHYMGDKIIIGCICCILVIIIIIFIINMVDSSALKKAVDQVKK